MEVSQCFSLFSWAVSKWSSGCWSNGRNRAWQEPASLSIEGFLPDQNDVIPGGQGESPLLFFFFPFLLFNPGNEPICVSMQKSRVNTVHLSDQKTTKYGPREPEKNSRTWPLKLLVNPWAHLRLHMNGADPKQYTTDLKNGIQDIQPPKT